MSIDLNLYCKKEISLDNLEAIIFPLGWEKEEKHENTYRWFHRESYESTRGAWLNIDYELSEETPEGTKTIFYTSTHAGRSYEDVEAQNKVLCVLKKHFGGIIYDPQTGKNSYLDLGIPKLSPSEKACGFSYINFQHSIGKIIFLKEEVDDEILNIEEQFHYMVEVNRSVLRNNVLIPYLVTCFEVFLKDFFIRYLNTHRKIIDKILKDKTMKINYEVLKELVNQEKTLAELQSEEYNFQNIVSANKAYKKYLKVSIYDILNSKFDYNGEKIVIREEIFKLLELRHKIIHEGFIKKDLSHDLIDKYYNVLKYFGIKFVEKFKDEKSFRINLEELL